MVVEHVRELAKSVEYFLTPSLRASTSSDVTFQTPRAFINSIWIPSVAITIALSVGLSRSLKKTPPSYRFKRGNSQVVPTALWEAELERDGSAPDVSLAADRAQVPQEQSPISTTH